MCVCVYVCVCVCVCVCVYVCMYVCMYFVITYLTLKTLFASNLLSSFYSIPKISFITDIIDILTFTLLTLFHFVNSFIFYLFLESEISFGEVSEGCEYSSPFTLKNTSSIPVDLVLDLTNYPDFTPILGHSGMIYFIIQFHTISTCT